ncbi:hypothetical protein ElyMa_003746600 [Elysia marginata]|uniref:Uncharacterized protein n=1 Tax=Elysia marginata TaxID=1093978 RepID=A0AAV4F7I0_9GAST|nr:hypothetical protein ElyMa_003746600 [Elysia marginata]
MDVVDPTMVTSARSTSRMPVSKWPVNGKTCTVLRDSRSPSFLIRRGLIAGPVAYTGTTTLRLADGSEKSVQTASFYIEGKTKIALLEVPLYDVILGNVN